MSVGKGSINRVNNISSSQKQVSNISPNIIRGNILDINKIKFVPQQWVFYDNSYIDLKDLKTSIKQFGILEPVIVRAHKDGSFQLLAGYGRIKAASEIGLTAVKCEILNDIDDETAKKIFFELHKDKHPFNQLHKAKFAAISRINHDLPDYLL